MNISMAVQSMDPKVLENISRANIKLDHYKAIAELDTKKRNDMYVRMMKIMEESGCFVWIAHPPNASLANESLVPSIWPNGNACYRKFKNA